MYWICMGKDELGHEFRPSDKKWTTEAGAQSELLELYDRYEEARALWVEPLKDKEYFMRMYANDQDYDY